MAAHSLDDSLQSPPESMAHLHDVVLIHSVPRRPDGSLQWCCWAMRLVAGNSLDMSLNVTIQWIQVRGAGGPHLLGPEDRKILGKPILGGLGTVAGGPILNEHVQVISELFLDWGLHMFLQEVDVDYCIDLFDVADKNWQALFAICGHDSKDCHRGCMLCLERELDVVRDILGLLVSNVPVRMAVGHLMQKSFSSENKMGRVPAFKHWRSTLDLASLLALVVLWMRFFFLLTLDFIPRSSWMIQWTVLGVRDMALAMPDSADWIPLDAAFNSINDGLCPHWPFLSLPLLSFNHPTLLESFFDAIKCLPAQPPWPWRSLLLSSCMIPCSNNNLALGLHVVLDWVFDVQSKQAQLRRS